MLHLLLSLSTVHKLFANFLSVSAFGAGFVGVFFFPFLHSCLLWLKFMLMRVVNQSSKVVGWKNQNNLMEDALTLWKEMWSLELFLCGFVLIIQEWVVMWSKKILIIAALRHLYSHPYCYNVIHCYWKTHTAVCTLVLFLYNMLLHCSVFSFSVATPTHILLCITKPRWSRIQTCINSDPAQTFTYTKHKPRLLMPP